MMARIRVVRHCIALSGEGSGCTLKGVSCCQSEHKRKHTQPSTHTSPSKPSTQTNKALCSTHPHPPCPNDSVLCLIRVEELQHPLPRLLHLLLSRQAAGVAAVRVAEGVLLQQLACSPTHREQQQLRQQPATHSVRS